MTCTVNKGTKNEDIIHVDLIWGRKVRVSQIEKQKFKNPKKDQQKREKKTTTKEY